MFDAAEGKRVVPNHPVATSLGVGPCGPGLLIRPGESLQMVVQRLNAGLETATIMFTR
jgi:hypothetical protein